MYMNELEFARGCLFFFFQAEDGIRDYKVTGVQTCALPIFVRPAGAHRAAELLVGQSADERAQPLALRIVLGDIRTIDSHRALLRPPPRAGGPRPASRRAAPAPSRPHRATRRRGAAWRSSSRSSASERTGPDPVTAGSRRRRSRARLSRRGTPAPRA